jgi:hypothetical protein
VFPGLDPDSTYTLRLHFADDWDNPNSRVQDLVINGDTVSHDFDIFVAAGKMKATIREYHAEADQEGNISLQFLATVDNALVCAIEVHQGAKELSAFNTRKNPYNINSGSNIDRGKFTRDALAAGGGTWSFTIFHPEFEADIEGLEQPAPVEAYTLLRFGNPFSYVFPGLDPDSTYTLRLHFADDWDNPNSRVQDLVINGDTVSHDFDIFVAAGKMKATIREYHAEADQEGNISLQFLATVDNALVCAIEVHQGAKELSAFNTRKNPYNINSGSNIDRGKFTGDRLFTEGNPWSHTIFHSGYQADTKGLIEPAPVDTYTTVRYGNPFGYLFPGLLPESNYVVRLHFADDWDEAGKRVQDVQINGVTVLSDFDIFKMAGKMVATICQFNATADVEGKILINFSASVDNALISAIENLSG